MLTPQINSAGYLVVRLSKYGRVVTVTVARVVLETFEGPRPPGKRASHGPGGKLDDRRENLWWG